MPVDTSSWPTKADVCETLGLSLSQVNNLIKQKRLEVRREKRFGAPPIGKINPRDVTREKDLREARETQAHVMPAGAIAPTTSAVGMPANRAQMPSDALRRLFEALPAGNAMPLDKKIWLNWDEAVAYSGLGKSRLRELVDEHLVRIERGPRRSTVLSRTDLDNTAPARSTKRF